MSNLCINLKEPEFEMRNIRVIATGILKKEVKQQCGLLPTKNKQTNN